MSYNPNKPQVLYVDVDGTYSITFYTSMQLAVDAFRHLVSKSSCLICDLRYCGITDHGVIASYKNYKYLKIKGY